MSLQPQSGQTHLPPLGFALLAALTLFWGANWPVMKIAFSELPVWWFRASCVLVGGLGLLAISAAAGNSLRVPRKDWAAMAVCAFFSFFGWHLLSGYGVSLIPAGRAAIIAFTMPVWAALLSSLLLGERITKAKVCGLLFGVSG